MTWIGWMVLIWAVLMLGGFALIGYWIGERKGARRAQEAPALVYRQIRFKGDSTTAGTPTTAPLRVQIRAVPTDTVQLPAQRLDVKA